MMFKTLQIVFVSVLIGCNSSHKKPTDICFADTFNQPVEKVSLKDVEKIKKLEGKFVQVEGFFRYDFEDVALYPSRSADPPEAMWLNLKLPKTVSDSMLHELSEKKVEIIGRVNLKSKGHYGAYIGTLDSTFCIRVR